MGGYVRPFAVLFIVALLSNVAVFYVPPVGAAHGCAPSTPPTIPGSPAPAPATQGVVLLNEVLLNPQSRWNCSEPGTTFTDQDAWVELYNPQNQAFNLYAAHAYLDSGPTTNPYYFPFGASIAAHRIPRYLSPHRRHLCSDGDIDATPVDRRSDHRPNHGTEPGRRSVLCSYH